MWYLVMSKLAAPQSQLFEKLDEHLDWMKKMHSNGSVLISGPTADNQLGIIVVKADTLEAAKECMDQEPFHLNGIREYEIYEWSVHQILGVGQFSFEHPGETSEN